MASRVLLDTHILLWALNDDKKLSRRQRSVFSDQFIMVVSAVSIWEIAIKRRLGKLKFDGNPSRIMMDYACEALDINWRHGAMVEDLPMHHSDPFDRLLIAQAVIENMPVLTADRQFAQYEIKLI